MHTLSSLEVDKKTLYVYTHTRIKTILTCSWLAGILDDSTVYLSQCFLRESSTNDLQHPLFVMDHFLS